MIPLLTLAVMVTVLAVSFLRYRDLLYPPVMQATLWTVILSLFLLNADAFRPLAGTTYLLLANGVVMFAAGSYLATYGYEAKKQRTYFVLTRPDWFLPAVIFVTAALAPLALRRAMQLASHGLTGSFLADLRAARGAGSSSFDAADPFNYVGLLTIAIASVAVVMWQRGKTLRVVIAIAVAAFYATLSTGRAAFFMLILATMGVLLITRRISASKGGLAFVGMGFAVFVILGYIIGKYAAGTSLSAKLQEGWAVMRLYMLGPLPALDLAITRQTTLDWGSDLFRPIAAVMYKIGLSDQHVSHFDPFVAIPNYTNTFTVYKPYLLDFGWTGMWLVQLPLGMMHGYLYRKADQGNAFCVFLFAISLHPLCLQFFTEKYVVILSVWVRFIAFAFLYLVILKRKQIRCIFLPSRAPVAAASGA
jgi:oligosaccharide repeat unit polymerase